MVMNKNRRLFIIAVVFITYNLLVFIIPFERGAVFWTAYFFSAITILAMIVTDWVAFRNVDSIKRAFMGVPIIKLAYSCLVTQLTICAIFMIAATFFPIPVWVLAVFCVLIIAFGAVSIFKADWGREIIEQIEERHLVNTNFMMDFRADLEALVPRISSSELKAKVEALAKTAKRSDPVSSGGLAEIEAEIRRKFELLKSSAVNNALENANALADEISHLLNERNLKCRTLKRQQQ